MNKYDSDTNTRMTEPIGNRELAIVLNYLFLAFMFAIISATSSALEGLDYDKTAEVTAESLAASTLEDLYNPMGLLISVIIFVYELIYNHYSAILIHKQNFKYQNE